MKSFLVVGETPTTRLNIILFIIRHIFNMKSFLVVGESPTSRLKIEKII
jgi:hypothetical protein